MVRYKRQVTSIGNIGVAQGVTAGTTEAQGLGQDLLNLGKNVSDIAFKEKQKNQIQEDKNNVFNFYRDIEPTVNDLIFEAQQNISEDEESYQERIKTIESVYGKSIDEKVNSLNINDRRKDAISLALKDSFSKKFTSLNTSRKTILKNININNVQELALNSLGQNLTTLPTDGSYASIVSGYNNEIDLYKNKITSSASGAIPENNVNLFQKFGKEYFGKYIKNLSISEQQEYLRLIKGAKQIVIKGETITQESLSNFTGANPASLQDLENQIKTSINDATNNNSSLDSLINLYTGTESPDDYRTGKVEEALEQIITAHYESDEEAIEGINSSVDLIRRIGMVDENTVSSMIDLGKKNPVLLNALVNSIPSLLISGRVANTVPFAPNDEYPEGGETTYTGLAGKPIKFLGNGRQMLEELMNEHKAFADVEDSNQKSFYSHYTNLDNNRFLNVEARGISTFDSDSNTDLGMTIGDHINKNPITFFQKIRGVSMSRNMIDNLNNSIVGSTSANSWISLRFTHELSLQSRNDGSIDGTSVRKAARNTIKAFKNEWKLNPDNHLGWVHEDDLIKNKDNFLDMAKTFFESNDVIKNSYLDQTIKDKVAEDGLDIDNIVFIPVATYDNIIEFPDDKKYIHEKSGETIEGTPIQETWYYVGYKDDNNLFTTYLSSNGIGNLNSGNNYIFKYAPPKDIKRHNSYVNFKETKLTNWKSTVMFPYQRYIP